MNFDFDEQQLQLQKSVQALVARALPIERIREALSAGRDADCGAELTGLGIPGILIPEEFGGSGLSFVDLVLVLEEFGRSLVSTAITETVMCGYVISRFGTNEQKK